ncbi:hypothetical protein AWRIB429_1375 [Oenococcus oeni AWRIB429]|uniref:Uncharacterized protein n=1 Tax=Oenococcus oeni AWRIB429 TaxID=655225 RepID=D3LAJ5_OENOE|nr:hypothetical protein AWRIB429_1375 [Oenococcus oeni AWRIB429]
MFVFVLFSFQSAASLQKQPLYRAREASECQDFFNNFLRKEIF